MWLLFNKHFRYSRVQTLELHRSFWDEKGRVIVGGPATSSPQLKLDEEEIRLVRQYHSIMELY
jgi:hypothetical protein